MAPTPDREAEQRLWRHCGLWPSGRLVELEEPAVVGADVAEFLRGDARALRRAA